MTTAFALALALGLTSPQIGPDPNLKANYHIDRSDQDAFTERLRGKIEKSDGSAWTNGHVEISFMCPLGLSNARNELVRNFTEQQISRLEISIDGKKIPYKDVRDIKAGEANFWTLDVDPLTTQDQVSIRIPSPGGTKAPILEVLLEGTLIYSTLKPGPAEGGYRFSLSPKMQSVALEMEEARVTVDPKKLAGQLSSLGLAPSAPFRFSKVLGDFAEFYAAQASYGKDTRHQEVNVFFGDSARRRGDCHTLNTPSLLALRSLGITAFYPSGRILGTSAGHATNYVYDSQLGDAFIANFSGISAGRYSGTAIERFNKGRPRNLIYFEIDRTYYHTFGIKGIASEPEPVPAITGLSNCGRVSVMQESKAVGTLFPDSVPGASSVRKLDPSDGRFVTFTEDGPKFRTAQGGNR